ncbi:MAG TPA: restriction endonuclease subunit S [Algoriphagus sp.]|nr:restriction endonuclease subunit S [Algoriphagus sp.]
MTDTKVKKSGLEFEVPEGWDKKGLQELCLKPIVYGIVQAGPNVSEGVPYLRSTDVGGEINIDGLMKTSFIIAKKYSRSVVKPGDIVFSLRGNIGETSIVPNDLKEANLTQGTARISCNPYLINSHFLKYSLSNSEVHRSIIRLAKGSTFQEISLNELRKIKVPLPPLPEQRAIAQVLGKMDEAIQTTECLITQKELRKKWLMQNLLTGKMRLKGFSGEWREVHLGEFFSERNETRHIELTLLSIGQSGIYPQDESIKKDTSNADKSKYKRICPGDIGYNTMRMWQGRSALSDLEGIVSPAYTVISPKENADSQFFAYLFKTPKLTHLFWRNSQGLVDDTLNCKFKDFSIVKVVLPQTREEQTTIARELQIADQEISLLKSKADKLRKQKKGMMQVLLTGKVRLKLN